MDSLYPSLYYMFEIFPIKNFKRYSYEEIIQIEYRIVTMNMYFFSYSIYLVTVFNFAIK